MSFDCHISFDQYDQSELLKLKVRQVKAYLAYRDIVVSDDITSATFGIKQRKVLYERIDDCNCVVLLLTRSFLEDRGQNRSEFGYYLRSKGRSQICLVLMEEELLDSVLSWGGEIGGALRGKR